jgi:UDP-3-O-[3-hydroxymyristoyl] glucosamine N-acyltransferase
MADPRFYDNRGPFALGALCKALGVGKPPGADLDVADLAGLAGAGPRHLSFFSGGRALRDDFAQSKAGACLVPAGSAAARLPPAPAGMILVACASVMHAWAAAARLFYPEAMRSDPCQPAPLSPDAKLGQSVRLGPGVVIGPGAEIGDGARIGAGTVIGRGVAIGRDCDVGANVTISHAYIGDRVIILPGVQIGQSGFGFASSAAGHVKIPQLGRVIIQDDVEIGAASTVDRGALGDTVIGEGTKLDNLVQVGHNARIGRHCIMVAQSGAGGSAVVGDFVVVGGQTGIGDHAVVGSGARLAGQTGVPTGTVLEGGRDYGGTPVKPVRQWLRETHLLARMTGPKQDDNG